MMRTMTVAGQEGQTLEMHLVPGTTCWTSSRANALAIVRRRSAEQRELTVSLRKLRDKMHVKRDDISLPTSADTI